MSGGKCSNSHANSHWGTHHSILRISGLSWTAQLDRGEGANYSNPREHGGLGGKVIIDRLLIVNF